MSDSGKNNSPWTQGIEATAGVARPGEPSSLHSDVGADVCIVGAGIAGMSTAYRLAREGKSIIVLDDGPVGGGETGRTTAHLSSALDDRYYRLESLHGREGARLAAESHRAAIDDIEAIIQRENIDADFVRVDGYLFNPPGESIDGLEREKDAARRAGLEDVDMVSRAPIQHFDTGPCLRFPRQAQFHPLKYLNGLALAIGRHGGRIFTGAHAVKVEGGSPARVRTASGAVVTAEAVVMATNAPIWDVYGLSTAESAYRTYAVGLRVPRDSIVQALYWDTPDPYHYVRLQRMPEDYDLLIVGGEDHKTGQSDDYEERFERLTAWTRERFPMAAAIEFRWSGQVLEPADGLAFIGPNPMDSGNVYVVTGDSGHGMTHGTIAGILLTDLIAGRANRWSGLYDPSRITLGALYDYAVENINTSAQFADWVTEGDVASRDRIAPGAGATVRDGLAKLAVYRDEQGVFHECSAICPHLGCVVSWNNTEKTWDCPCHGSRFDPYGVVLNGPANRNLEPGESYSALLSAAGVGLRNAASIATNVLIKVATLGIRIGRP